MEGIYVGKITRSKVDKGSADLLFIDHRQDVSHLDSLIKYDDTAYCLVPTDDIIINNDELLRLRDEVKQRDDECNEWKKRYLREERNRWKSRFDKADKENQDLEDRVQRLSDKVVYWHDRFTSVMTDFGKVLAANGVTFEVKNIDNDGNWDVGIDIPELNEAKAKVADLEKKLAASKSNKAYWRDRKEEEEDYHHYWLHTFDRAVKKAADKGIHIDIRCTDEACNAGVVVVDNMKAEELEKQVVALEKTNKNLDQKHDAKWSAMCDALKAKGVEVIYMGEEDGKPIVDVKIPAIDILRKDYVVRGQIISDLKKELEELKSRTLDNVEIRLSCGDIVWTYCDGFVHVSSGIDGIISADEISTGTVPKCSSCAHYMHNPSRFAHDWCYMPVPKEGGAGYIRKLNKEEVEGPACADFKAKE